MLMLNYNFTTEYHLAGVIILHQLKKIDLHTILILEVNILYLIMLTIIIRILLDL